MSRPLDGQPPVAARDTIAANPDFNMRTVAQLLGVTRQTIGRWVGDITERRREIRKVKSLILSRAGWSLRDIGEKLGIHHDTVSEDVNGNISRHLTEDLLREASDAEDMDSEEFTEAIVQIRNDQTTTSSDWTEDQTPPEHDRAGDQAELIESLLDQLAYMREQLAEEREARRRADTIMAQLSQANAEQARTIRALEPSRDEPHGPEAVSETTEGTDIPLDRGDGEAGTSSPTTPERRSWWRRWFGIE